MRNIFSKSYNTMKLCICTKESSIQSSEIHVLKMLQFSELTYMYSITFNSNVRYMYLSIFDIVKYITCLLNASI